MSSQTPTLPRSSPGPTLRSNFRHLYQDVFWYGVLAGSAVAFLTVYAARLGATGFQLGLLTAGPALANLVVSLPAGRWLEHHSLIRAVFYTSILHRAGYLILIILPWLLPSSSQVGAVALIVLAMSVPGTILAIAFNAMFADVVPPEWRGHVVGRRNALLAVSIMVTSLACGRLLDWIAFPLNYQIVFGVGVLGAALSSYHLGHIRAPAAPPQRVGRPLRDLARPGLMRFVDVFRSPPGLRFLTRSGGKPLLRLDLVRGPFGSFLAAYLLLYTVQYLPIPLFPLVFVQELHLSDGAISLGHALFHLAVLLGSTRLARISVRFGHRRVLVLGALLFGLYPLLLALAADAGLFWVASFIGGSVWALLGGGLVNRLMERVSPDDLPAHMALHNLVLNLGMLCGALIGPVLGQEMGLREALLLSAGLRLLIGFVISAWS